MKPRKLCKLDDAVPKRNTLEEGRGQQWQPPPTRPLLSWLFSAVEATLEGDAEVGVGDKVGPISFFRRYFLKYEGASARSG